jgi:predicted dehydrogenase
VGHEAVIRTALIGYGVAGSVFHGPLISAAPGMQIATIVTSDPERQQRARREHPGANVISRIDDFDVVARDHELVVVATANRHHVPLARAALEAGLAVVVEKPMAPTAVEARELVMLARARRSLLTVFHNRRWDSEILTLQRLLAEDRLGAVARVESRFERWRPDVVDRWRESQDPLDGGGLLLDLGTHLVDQALHLFGRPSHAYAEVAVRRPGAAVDDDDFIALHHRGGVRAHLRMSVIAAAAGPRLRVLGVRGSYVKETLDAQEEALQAGLRADSAGWGREPPERWGTLVDSAGSHPIESEPGGWPQFYALLSRALHGAGPVPVPPEDAVAVLEVIEAARESARSTAVTAVRYSDLDQS